MKLVSWNVNGIRACITKGFLDYFKEIDADIFAIQESKAQPNQIDLNLEGYHTYINSAEKKGYSGVCVFSKVEPIKVTYGFGIDQHDHEGRDITCEYEDFYFVCVYTPNSKDGLLRLDYRMEWEDDFKAYLNGLRKNKGVIVCGDLNVAHQEIDLKNPKTNRRNAGFTDEERNKMSELLNSGFIDSYRYLYPEKIEYSWWSYRFKSREKNAGWRIDYFLVSEELKHKIKDSQIHTHIFGSDHCPVMLEYDI